MSDPSPDLKINVSPPPINLTGIPEHPAVTKYFDGKTAEPKVKINMAPPPITLTDKDPIHPEVARILGDGKTSE